MTGRMRPSSLRSEQDFPGVVLQQERVGDDEPVEHPDDVAVLQGVLAAAARRRDGRWRRDLSSTISYFVNGARSARRGAEEPHDRAPGRSIRTTCRASACAAVLARKSKMSQHRTPSTLASPWRKRDFERRRQSRRACPSRACRSKSANRSSMNSLQPRRSPKNATLLPMTGPKSMSTGDVGWCASAPRNFGNAFDGTTGSSPRRAGASPGGRADRGVSRPSGEDLRAWVQRGRAPMPASGPVTSEARAAVSAAR